MRKLFLILMTLMACSWSLTAQTSHTYHGTVVGSPDDVNVPSSALTES